MNCGDRDALLLSRSKTPVPAGSRVTFFPKPKKVTKERFALRWALLARGGRCVDELLFFREQTLALFCNCCYAVEVFVAVYTAVAATGYKVENRTKAI